MRRPIGVLVFAGLISACGGGGNNGPIVFATAVQATGNPQVAQYALALTGPAAALVQFGTDTSYQFKTSSQSSSGGQLNILVAGMKAFTTYHMRAVVTSPDGRQFTDADHVFTTSGPPSSRIPDVTVNKSGLTPNPGIELLDLVSNSLGSGVNNQLQVAAVDVDGNLLWFYDDPTQPHGFVPLPAKFVADGNLVVNYTNPSPLLIPTPGGQISTTREVDLAGNTIWQFTGTELENAIIAAGLSLPEVRVHHDFVQLPNGHLVLICGVRKDFTNLPGFPGTTTVSGDALVDIDSNRKPVWVWSEFDHLDVNRHPLGLPDWTHSNAIIYSPDDGNLILSIRNQHWIVKIDYQNGKGSGNILWKLGYQGDFALVGATDPIDWFYAQHAPKILSSNSTGVFTLALIDNGNSRVLDAQGHECGTPGQVACHTRTAIFEIDEKAKAASITWQDNLSLFSIFGGYVQQLGNNDIEFSISDTSMSPPSSAVLEVTDQVPPRTVWQLDTAGQFSYRAFRIPSLYAGVQW